MSRPLQPINQEAMNCGQEFSVKVQGKHIITAPDLYGIITQLRAIDYTEYKNNAEYKSNMKQRILDYHGIVIEYLSDREFINELIRVEFITGWAFKNMFGMIVSFGDLS